MTDEERKERKRAYNAKYAKDHPEYHHRWYEANRERLVKLQAAWNEANRERIAKTSAAWYEANRDRVAKTSAAWAKANPEKVRAKAIKYYRNHPNKEAVYRATNRERIAKRGTAWYEANKERALKRSEEWYEANKERRAQKGAAWDRAHRETRILHCSKRRSLKYGNTPISEMLTSVEWLAILALADGHCAYCGKEAKLTLDHIIPLSKGGKHSKDNVVPACAHCNSSKGNKTLEEWNAKRLTQAKQ